jgi:hypothetical protein
MRSYEQHIIQPARAKAATVSRTERQMLYLVVAAFAVVTLIASLV